MSGDYSDGEGPTPISSTETEVELRLPLEVDMKPDQPREDVPAYSGAIDPDAVNFGQDEQRRCEPIQTIEVSDYRSPHPHSGYIYMYK